MFSVGLLVNKKRFGFWEPWSFDVLHKIIADADYRFIESGEQLIDVAIKELNIIQSSVLGGENTLRRLLWNIYPKTSNIQLNSEPKDERDLSIFIKKFLEIGLLKYNVSLTLEPEKERGYGKGNREGERIDIRLEYQLEGQKPIIAYIEVKKDSHSEVETAIKTQLSERYLRDGGYGIYLVGWYGKQNGTIDSLTGYLETEARNLSTDGKLIKSFVMDISLK